jgi:hypothetical protein
MRTLLMVVGSLLVLAGAVWSLQGLGILPGSFMTGQLRWALYGGLTIGLGVLVLAFARRPRV